MIGLTRRRFLVVAAASMAGRADARTSTEWQGRALGADAAIKIEDGGARARTALNAAVDAIRRMERLFSLYDSSSVLSRLNARGEIAAPPEFLRLCNIANHIHQVTMGRFDPTVQPLFRLYLRKGGRPTDGELRKTLSSVGWSHVLKDGSRIRFARGRMALTFNGIAQGFATDRICEVLQAHGFAAWLVNVGEYRAGDAGASIGLADEAGRMHGRIMLKRMAVATTSPGGYRFPDGSSHILRPDGKRLDVRWRTVSAISDTAAVADGLSTAIALEPDDRLARALIASGEARKIILQDQAGKVTRLCGGA